MRGRKQDGLGPSDRLVMRSKASHTQVTAARCTRTCETNQSKYLAFPFFSKIKNKNLTFPIRRSSVLLRRLICPSLCRSSLGASAARCLHGTQQSDNSAFQQYGNTYVCERRSVPISMFGCSWSIRPSLISVVSLVRILNYSSHEVSIFWCIIF